MAGLGEVQQAMQYNRQQQSAPWQAGGNAIGTLMQILAQIIQDQKIKSQQDEAQQSLQGAFPGPTPLATAPPNGIDQATQVPNGQVANIPFPRGGSVSMPVPPQGSIGPEGFSGPVTDQPKPYNTQEQPPDMRALAMMALNQKNPFMANAGTKGLGIAQMLQKPVDEYTLPEGSSRFRAGTPIASNPKKVKPELPGGFAQMSPEQQAIEYNKIYPGSNVTADSFKQSPDKNPDWVAANNPKGKPEFYDKVKNAWTGVFPPANASSAAMAPMLGKDALDMQAEQYLSTGNLPQTGFGLAGTKMRADIITRAAAMQKERGLPQQVLATNKAAYTANQSALTQMTKMSQNIDAYTTTATKNMDLALQQSPKVPRTGSPLANRFYQWANGQQLVGNPELTRFETYIYTAAREYAKVTQGAAMSAAGLTDSAAREVEKLINAAQTPDAFRAAVQSMKDDMANVKSSYEQQRQELQDRIGELSGTKKPTTQPATTGTTGGSFWK